MKYLRLILPLFLVSLINAQVVVHPSDIKPVYPSTVLGRWTAGPGSAEVLVFAGVANEVSATFASGSITLSLPTALNFTGKTISGGTFTGGTYPAASTLTFGTHLTGTSYNGSTPVTLATDATNANTVSTIVARDGSGNFSAGTITANLTGNISGTAPAGTLTGTTLASNVIFAPGLNLPVNVAQYGATGNTVVVTNGAMTATSATLTSATAGFVLGDVGKLVAVSGAGATGVELSGTITGFTNSTTVTISAAASTTVTGATVTFGTDDSAAIQAALTAIPSGGGTLSFPAGGYSLGAAIYILDRSNVTVQGAGKQLTTLYVNRVLDHSHLGIGGNGAVWGAILADSTTTTRIKNIAIQDLAVISGPGAYLQGQKLLYCGLVDGYSVRRCYFTGNVWESLFANCATNGNGGIPPINLTYENNVFVGGSGTGINTQSNGTVNLPQINNVIVSHNTFTNWAGLSIQIGGNNVDVHDNLATSSGSFWLGGDGPGRLNNYNIHDNVFDTPTNLIGTQVILVQTAEDASGDPDGIKVTGNVIRNIPSNASASVGIDVRCSATVDGNLFSGVVGATQNAIAIRVSVPSGFGASSNQRVHLSNNVVENTTNTDKWGAGVSITSDAAHGDRQYVFLSSNYVGDITSGLYALAVSTAASSLYPNVYFENERYFGQIILRKGEYSGALNIGGAYNGLLLTGNNVSLPSSGLFEPIFFTNSASSRGPATQAATTGSGTSWSLLDETGAFRGQMALDATTRDTTFYAATGSAGSETFTRAFAIKNATANTMFKTVTDNATDAVQINGSLGLGTVGSMGRISSSSGNITIAAQGSNQNLNLTGSGTGWVAVSESLAGTSPYSAPLQVTNTSSANGVNGLNVLFPNMPTGQTSYFNMGHDGSTNNWSSIGFSYVGAGSSSNAFTVAFFGTGSKLSVTAGGATTVTGTLAVSGTSTLTGGIIGVATNSNAAAGNVGEYISSLIPSGSAVSLTTATAANVTSISLTAGDWDVSGHVNYALTAATVTQKTAGVSQTSATLPTDGTEQYSGVSVSVSNASDSIALESTRISLSGTATIYLVGRATFSLGAVSAYGGIFARRRR